MPYNLMKKKIQLQYEEGESLINFNYKREKSLLDFKVFMKLDKRKGLTWIRLS